MSGTKLLSQPTRAGYGVMAMDRRTRRRLIDYIDIHIMREEKYLKSESQLPEIPFFSPDFTCS